MSQCHSRQRKTYVYVEEEEESCGSTETGSEYESASSDSEEECERPAQWQSSSRILSGIGSGSQVAAGAGSAAFDNRVSSVKKVVGSGSAAFGNSVSVATGGGERQQKHRQEGGGGGGCGGVGGGGGGGGGVGYSYQQQQEYNNHKANGGGYSKQQQHNSYEANGKQRLDEQYNYQQQQYSSYKPSGPTTYQGFEELPFGAAQHYNVGHKAGAKHNKAHRIEATGGYMYDYNLGPGQSNLKPNNYAPYDNYYENNRQQSCELDTVPAPTSFALDHYNVAGAKHPKNRKIDGMSGYTYDYNLGLGESSLKSNNYASCNNYYENNSQRLCEIDSVAPPTFPWNHDPHMATIEEACISYFRKTKIYGD